MPTSRWKSSKQRSTVSLCTRTETEYGLAQPEPRGPLVIASHRQKSRASNRVAQSHATSTADRNLNQRSRSIPYERTVGLAAPAAAGHRRTTRRPPPVGPLTEQPIRLPLRSLAASDPTAGTSNTDRSRTSSKSSNMTPTVGPLSVHHGADMPMSS